mmetsp:Transcript_90377/g.189013  ORF Transcript_90377/g.189013 Transcript_90377/m.189013 type:complete len:238 (+) Transcript_90377:462-1175(+)
MAWQSLLFRPDRSVESPDNAAGIPRGCEEVGKVRRKGQPVNSTRMIAQYVLGRPLLCLQIVSPQPDRTIGTSRCNEGCGSIEATVLDSILMSTQNILFRATENALRVRSPDTESFVGTGCDHDIVVFSYDYAVDTFLVASQHLSDNPVSVDGFKHQANAIISSSNYSGRAMNTLAIDHYIFRIHRNPDIVDRSSVASFLQPEGTSQWLQKAVSHRTFRQHFNVLAESLDPRHLQTQQ